MSNFRYCIETPAQSPVNRDVAKLLYVSTAKYGGDWHSLLHAHPCTELFYVVGGQGQFQVSGQVLPVEADSLVIVNPNVEHTELSLNASPLEYIVLGVEGLAFQAEESSECGYSLLNLRGVRDSVLPHLRAMLQEIEAKPMGYQVVCQDLLEILVMKLMRHSRSALWVTPMHRATRECAAVRRYLDSHYKENLSLNLLAQVAHLNKYHLAHQFRREFGVSPIHYLLSRRIAESRQLLADTDLSISQISQTLGFSSPSYFSQSFRRAEGVSPQEYRRKSR